MIGGEHYDNMRIEPWVVIQMNRLDFFEGSALKYLLRHKSKAGIVDLKKAIDVLEKMIRSYDELYNDDTQQKTREDDRSTSSKERENIRECERVCKSTPSIQRPYDVSSFHN